MGKIDAPQIETVREACQAMKDGRWLALSSADDKFIAETYLHVLEQRNEAILLIKGMLQGPAMTLDMRLQMINDMRTFINDL